MIISFIYSGYAPSKWGAPGELQIAAGPSGQGYLTMQSPILNRFTDAPSRRYPLLSRTLPAR